MSNGLIAARADQDPLVAVAHATAAVKLPKKFHVFHQWHFWKAANVQEDSASAEYPVVAASHSQQNSGVMRKTVCQPINGASRQANSKVTSDRLRIFHNMLNLIQTTPRNFSVTMHKPQHIATRGTRTHVHLHRPIGFAPNELIAKTRAEISCVIAASAVGHNNLRFWRSVAQMLKKWAYQ
jgi:hypothetical protein